MGSNLAGRLRNTNLPFQHGLMPVFESVVNSIQAIEDADNSFSGKIRVEIQRSLQQTFSDFGKKRKGPDPRKDIIGFVIEDNGIGFNDENLNSFEEFDSMLKANRGCRGIGRLMWLKAFAGAKISSVFINSIGQACRRSFVFTDKGMTEPEEVIVSEKPGTRIELYDFKTQYRKNVAKTLDAIAKAMLSHCSWYFLRPGGCPDIEIVDGGERVILQDLFDKMMGSKDDCAAENLYIDEREFSITHIKMRAKSFDISHSLYLCAGERLVQAIPIKGKLPGLFEKISDEKGAFIYTCYVSGTYLDENVRPERTSFDIPQATETSSLFSQNAEISLERITNAILEQSKCYLGKSLLQNAEASKERLTKFVNYRAPRYRSVLKHLSDAERYVDPTISDRELELNLHKRLMDLEAALIEEGQNILKPQLNESITLYSDRVKPYLEKLKDVKDSDLASYVFHRKVILDILQAALVRDPQTGKYAHEDVIHQLIMPMQKDSTGIHSDNANLWVINENLAFHAYLGSDLPIKNMPITGSDSTKEPDICVLNLYDNPLLVNPPDQNYCPASLTIIEFKRPMRNDAKAGSEDDPIEQALTYLQKIREGNVKTAFGRPINNASNIPGFCYIISDITPTVRKRAGFMGLTETPDKMGFFGYNTFYSSYVEVISFDKLLLEATNRNRAFFDKLGLPIV